MSRTIRPARGSPAAWLSHSHSANSGSTALGAGGGISRKGTRGGSGGVSGREAGLRLPAGGACRAKQGAAGEARSTRGQRAVKRTAR
jgi:hypothetical protein